MAKMRTRRTNTSLVEPEPGKTDMTSVQPVSSAMDVTYHTVSWILVAMYLKCRVRAVSQTTSKTCVPRDQTKVAGQKPGNG